MASDKNHRPCLPLKPQEKSLRLYWINKLIIITISKKAGFSAAGYAILEWALNKIILERSSLGAGGKINTFIEFS